MFRKVKVSERLPEVGKFVTTIDEAGEHRVYRLTEYGWNMRDADGNNSPNNNLPITCWLEEFDGTELERKAKLLDEIDESVSKFYDEDDEGNQDEGGLISIGEVCAQKLGYL